MGLMEKRKAKELQENVLPQRQKELAALCGVAIPLEVDWNTFSELSSLDYLDSWTFPIINEAFAEICVDDLGKECVRETIHRIHIANVPEGQVGQSVENGVLHLRKHYGDVQIGFQKDEIVTVVSDAC